MMIKDYKNWLYARQYSKKTLESYIGKIQKFLIHHPDPSAITEDTIKRYFSKLRKSGISLSYFELNFYAIRNFFDYLNSSDKLKLKINPRLISNLKPLHRQKQVPKILSNDELSSLLRAPNLKMVRGCRDYTIMLFLLHGLRAQEVCSLNMDQIFRNGWGPGRKMVIDVIGKGRKKRRVVIENSGDTEWAWNRYLNMRNGYNSDIAFPALLGKGKIKRMTTNGLYCMIKRYGIRLEIKNIYPHLWRHTTAVKLLEEGVSLKEIQYRLGHESVQTTEKYLGAATILQEDSANTKWIHNIRKADARFRRWRR